MAASDLQTEPAKPAPVTPEKTPEGTSRRRDRPGERGADGEEPAKEEAPEEKLSTRPLKLVEWTADDLLTAARENDPRFADAVAESLATKKPQTIAVVREGLNEVTQGETPSTPLSSENLEKLVAVLTSADTDEAWQVIRDLVLGNVKVANDLTATTAALKALAKHPSDKNDEVLLLALTEPEKARPASATDERPQPTRSRRDRDDERPSNYVPPGAIANDPGKPLTAAALQGLAETTIHEEGGVSIRRKLAAYLLNLEGGDPRIQQFCPLIEKPVPDNVAAQLLMYANPKPPELLKVAFERLFTDYSSTALAFVLGMLALPTEKPEEALVEEEEVEVEWGAGLMPSGAWGGATARRHRDESRRDDETTSTVAASDLAHDPDLLFRVVKRLWEPSGAVPIGDRVDQVITLQEPSQVVALARTMPLDDIRARLYTLLNTRFSEGPFPAVIERVGRYRSDGPPCDPGFYVIVKMLAADAEKRAPRARAPAPVSSRDEDERPGRRGVTMTGPGDVAQAWIDAAETLRGDLCSQCEKAAATGVFTTLSGVMPIEPHTDTAIVAQYHLKLPDNALAGFSGFPFDPLEVHYVRIEESTQPVKLLAYYRRMTKVKHEEIGNNEGAWFGALDDAGKEGWKRSIDVLITRPPGSSPPSHMADTRPGKRAPDEPLIVEILTVEIKDPSIAKGQE